MGDHACLPSASDRWLLAATGYRSHSDPLDPCAQTRPPSLTYQPHYLGDVDVSKIASISFLTIFSWLQAIVWEIAKGCRLNRISHLVDLDENALDLAVRFGWETRLWEKLSVRTLQVVLFQ